MDLPHAILAFGAVFLGVLIAVGIIKAHRTKEKNLLREQFNKWAGATSCYFSVFNAIHLASAFHGCLIHNQRSKLPSSQKTCCA